MNQSVGKIELISQKQMITNMLERILYKNKDVLSETDKKELQNNYLNSDKDYNLKLEELTAIHAYNKEEMQQHLNKNTNIEAIQNLNDLKSEINLTHNQEPKELQPREKGKVLIKKKNDRYH
ncbi:MAG: hypothetical protein PHD10_03720 [Bacilli bacterium]|nr:hypothetical protein [Bacilli bacterium]MDD4608218.1 hypothetical protein [Bacilli bacterium]